ncbi:MAG: GNAT family N-acetyltransferase [Alphaproteobacteria bacterium]|nr:GNAT family N-acetyltransferase [Alphaproteobacteria bacterium]
MYIIEPLESHDRKNFDCGEEIFNRYLRERAAQDIRRKLNRVFVLREENSEKIFGYYTLAATTIEARKLSADRAKHLPAYPLPAALLGKLAVDKARQGRGIGKLLLANAVRRVQRLEKEMGIHVLVVDPFVDRLAKFYVSVGFRQFLPERRLFLFMDNLEK